jgi:nicotinate-nucleotide pyrophosphorylase (carboxylating)
MNFFTKHHREIDRIIEAALKEDIGAGDITTDMIVPEAAVVKGVFTSKGEGIICGLPVMEKVFRQLDKSVKIDLKKRDGDRVRRGEVLAVVRGNARAVLKGERLALNIMQRLSGIATSTGKFAEITRKYGVIILDTRKTTPNLRLLEKYAVKTGGGENHRMGLYDQVLIKDNHLDYVDLEKAMRDLRQFLPRHIKIEIEVDTLDVLARAIEARPDIIMLDNMDLHTMEKAIAKMREAKCGSKIEVSGGVNLRNVGDIARLKPDYISIGSITHSPEALDISLRFVK